MPPEGGGLKIHGPSNYPDFFLVGGLEYLALRLPGKKKGFATQKYAWCFRLGSLRVVAESRTERPKSQKVEDRRWLCSSSCHSSNSDSQGRAPRVPRQEAPAT